jgi:hypothetical protein
MPDNPARTLISAGYRQIARVSMLKRARELGASPVPKLLLDTVLTSLRDGYCAYVFESGR